MEIHKANLPQDIIFPFEQYKNWEAGVRKPPEYIIEMLKRRIQADLINRKTIAIPKFAPQKKELPKRSSFLGSLSWLKAVKECVGESFVFALDEALMCQGGFRGRSNEYIVWGYGDNSALEYNGIVLLGNKISSYNVNKKNGLRFTDFNRTIADALANELILDMQGITEALSKYYYTNGDSFDGIFVVHEYSDRFDSLSEEAKKLL